MQMDLWKILEKNMDQKQELRKRMKEKRDRISPQERRQKSAKICERLLSAPEYARFWFMPRLEAKSNCSFSAIRHFGTENRFFSRRCVGRKWSFTGLRIPDS